MDVTINSSHYAVAVQDLEKAIESYSKILGLEITERGENPWGNFSWAQMGYVGEQAIQLIQPNSDDTHVRRTMDGRINKNNQYGEGYYISVWQSDDPIVAANNIEAHGGRVIDRGDGSGVHWIHHSAAHGLFMEVVPTKENFPGKKILELSHLFLLVNDLDDAINDFSNRFDWNVIENYKMDKIIESNSVMIGNTHPQLNLIDTSQANSAIKNFIEQNALNNNQGFFGACWRADNINEFEEHLTKNNIEYHKIGNSINISSELLHGINTFVVD